MNLRTAGLVLGWLGLAGSAFTMSRTLDRLTKYDLDEVHDYEPDPSVLDYNFDRTSTVRSTFEGDVILLTLSIFNALVTGMLINGIISNKHRFLLPWLILKGFLLTIGIPCAFLALFGAAISNKPYQIVASVILFLIIGLCLWFWMVIYSLYKEIRTPAKKPLTFFENFAQNNTAVPYEYLEKN